MNVIRFPVERTKASIETRISSLKTIPDEALFENYKNFSEKVPENFLNVDFVIWGEALEEEISERKLTRAFDKLMKDLGEKSFLGWE